MTAERITPHLPSTMPDWERRFRAPRIGLPTWAADAPHRCACIATADGTIEVHCWDQATGTLIQTTARREGTVRFAIDPGGEWIWWFDDSGGDERGVWRRQPFGSDPGEGMADATGLPSAYDAGLAIGRHGLAIVGSADADRGYRIHRVDTGDQVDTRLLYQSQNTARVGGLSEDGTVFSLVHSEHGDSRHPALRVLSSVDGAPIAELWDGPGRGAHPLGFAPITGDRRLLVEHERHGRPGLLVWDVGTGTESELDLDLPGEVTDASWHRDGRALLVAVNCQARTRLHRVETDESGLSVASVRPVGPSDGTTLAVTSRPGGDAWLLWSSAREPSAIRTLSGEVVIVPPGQRAPQSVPLEDLWVNRQGLLVHALLRRPVGSDGVPTARPLPVLVDVHGGPAAQDSDAFRAAPAAWVDHGFAVVQVNYRGSTGYGSGWRDALKDRVGHTELDDIVSVYDHLVTTGVADPAQIVLSGTSWGGYLTLLGLGLYPDLWAAGIAAAPVADYIVTYQDETEDLKSFDRSLFGGSPDELPDKYRDSSPITYVDAVRAPVLILAGRNDPRCPIRQIENYVDALARRGAACEVYRHEAGHGSLVDEERVRQTRTKIDFVRRHLGVEN